MRTIDADKLKNMKFSKGLNVDGILYVPFCEVMDNIKTAPTVFDDTDAVIAYGTKCYRQGREDWIDAVVASLECAESVKNFGSRNSGNLLIPLSEAINIVRKGGSDG